MIEHSTWLAIRDGLALAFLFVIAVGVWRPIQVESTVTMRPDDDDDGGGSRWVPVPDGGPTVQEPWVERPRKPTGASVFPRDEESRHTLDCDEELICPCGATVLWLDPKTGEPLPNGPLVVHDWFDDLERAVEEYGDGTASDDGDDA